MRLLRGLFVMGAILTGGVSSAQAFGYGHSWPHAWKHPHAKGKKSFSRIATLSNYLNNADIGEATVSEIVSATADGNTLIYTDSPLEEIGFVDITDPSSPAPLGKLGLGGEPTSVSLLGNDLALVGVNTSDSFVSPDGYLAVVDVVSQAVITEIPLGGQPDSVAVSKSGLYAAVVIENERDEETEVDGEEGGLPQLPAGQLIIVDLAGAPETWGTRGVDLTGLSVYAPSDPEPEFVDINADDEAVVSLQENNHVAVVDLASGAVISDFDCGTQTLVGVDDDEDGIISLTDTIEDVPREPDAIAWVDTGRVRLIATANEGDLFGGSRGFSLFSPDGELVYDSGSSFEEIAVRHGHYPEDRSENKGSEPEAVEFARFGKQDYLFVGSERGSFVAVYEVARDGTPEFLNVLPAPLGPEGLLAIPSRNLLIASGEEDDPSFGVRSSIMIYELAKGNPTYPQLVSADDEDGKPIAWSAMSGMTSIPGSRSNVLAVWDSYYSESRIFTIDTSETPAVVTSAVTIEGGTGDYDPEGIVVAPDGTYWVASEGDSGGGRPNRLLQVDPDGTLIDEVGLPAEIEACRAATTSTATRGSGFEGLTVRRTGRRGYELLVAQQRGWDYTTPECEGLDDDPDASNPAEPGQTRIWTYAPRTGRWGHYGYQLEALPANASWVGLSEITSVPGGYVVIERDNRTGDFARLKTLVRFSHRALRDGIVTSDEKEVYDVLPDLLANNGLITDKPEGVAVLPNGRVFLVTDNDGVEDWSGETWFLELGKLSKLF